MRFVGGKLEPFGDLADLHLPALERSSTPIAGLATAAPALYGTLAPQVTSGFGCTLTGSSGSTPVTVSRLGI
ncbi:hypothetical protein A8144_12625 [Mycobacterium leprae 3125609]|nr:hypothetical protein A8144_12625 [Mycobacterium leprae 3125609]OAX70385.1 hypothetical protein A3216_12260 [Mycobacterium leprae 7935681]